jgi:hypothetical protein
MPTVKLQNGNVILKDGKVSCTCCDGPEPGECCLYPADGLGDTYEAADLPDAITTIDPVLLAFISISRTGTTYETLDRKGGPITLEHTVDGWKLTYFTYPDQGDDPPEIYTNTEDCLIGDYDDGSHFVEDQFADCYEVEFDGVGVIVTRISLCRWEGFSGSGIASVFFLQNEQKWATSIETGFGQQSGFKSNQSSPEGTYDQDISDPFTPIVIVTEITCP